jgi:hypothetical protein
MFTPRSWSFTLTGTEPEEPILANCIVVVQFDLPKRTEEQAIKGGTSTAPT